MRGEDGNRNQILNIEIIENGTDTHRQLRSLSYSFKAQRTPQRTDQLRILGCDLDRSNLAHTKNKKNIHFLLAEKGILLSTTVKG